ncbi:MAG: type II secretion system protein GspG [Thermoanaerobaculia bacterium]
MRIRRDKRGFTLIELLIVVAIIGIIVAIAIPNLLNAVQRAKQKRTMADMRSIGTALEAYAVDYNKYPAAAGAYSMPSGITGISLTNTIGSAVGALSPTYIRTMPLKDGWNSYFHYTVSGTGLDYILGSTGKDGAIEGAPVLGPTTNFNNDILFADGQFIQWPEGTQQ